MSVVSPMHTRPSPFSSTFCFVSCVSVLMSFIQKNMTVVGLKKHNLLTQATAPVDCYPHPLCSWAIRTLHLLLIFLPGWKVQPMAWAWQAQGWGVSKSPAWTLLPRLTSLLGKSKLICCWSIWCADLLKTMSFFQEAGGGRKDKMSYVQHMKPTLL